MTTTSKYEIKWKLLHYTNYYKNEVEPICLTVCLSRVKSRHKYWTDVIEMLYKNGVTP